MTTFADISPAASGVVLDAVERAVVASRARLDAHDRERTYPRDVLDELRVAGVASLFDDAHATAHQLAALNAITASESGSLAITLGVNALALLPLYIAGSEAQRARVRDRMRAGASVSLLLTEWDHGSDLIRNEARADATAGGFRLAGTKHLINGGAEHELLVCLLRTRGGDSASVSDFTLFLVERGAEARRAGRSGSDGPEASPYDQVRAIRRHRTLPCAAADISDVALDGVVVGDDAVIGGVGEGFALVQRTLAISRGGVGALASGAATAARRLATAHARERVLYGRPIVFLGAIGEHLARLHALDLAAAALAVKQAAVVNALGHGAAYATAIAKVGCTGLAEEAVEQGRRVLGARALVEGPYARLIRDVTLYGVFDGTTHVMLEELQWRLAQLAHKRAPASLADLARIYAVPARALRDAVRTPGRVHIPPIAAHLAELARISGDPSLAHAATIATALLDGVSDLRRGVRWDGDQALRFAAATALVQLEAIAAVAELADPACRRALGIGPREVTAHAQLARFAIAWLGARVAAAVRAIVLRTAVDPAPIDHAECELHAAVDTTIVAVILQISNPER